MNYGGMDASAQPKYAWTKWQKQFLWLPKKIKGKWYWLRTIYFRQYMADWDPQIIKEEQYAVDLFDLMMKNNR